MGENTFIQDLILDAIRKIDAVSDKVDDKMNALEEKMDCNHEDLRDGLVKRLEPLERRVEEATMKLSRHEHNFTILGFLVTGGLASLTGIFNWIGNFFGNHK